MKYLARLKMLKTATYATDKTDNCPENCRKGQGKEPTKSTENTFDPFVSTEGGHNPENAPLPFLDSDGSVVIPFGCDRRYHWWAGGQTIEATEREFKKLREDSDGINQGTA